MLYIGEDVKNRMNILGLTADEVAEKAFMEKEDIDAIINNKTALEQIDEFDMSLISSILHCKKEFFLSEDIKEKDTTDYINQVEDDYEWNTTDEYSRAIALHNYFAGDEVKNDK